jgi:hypothetical protein
MENQELEFSVGDDENSATVELTTDGSSVVTEEVGNQVDGSSTGNSEDELEEYSGKVKKRIDKLTARLRETQRREAEAINFAKNAQQRAKQLEEQFQRTDAERLGHAKSRMETETMTLKQIIRKAREEGDFDTETEAQERLTSLMFDQRQVSAAAAQRQSQTAQYQYQQQQEALRQQQVAQAPRRAEPDPQAEEWAERNQWYGQDVAMTHAAQGIHIQLVKNERFDPNSNEYYDELDRRIQESFPQKFSNSSNRNNRANRPVQTVAPATRSSGVNGSARRTVRLSPSQVAIAKKLGVPLEEYAKYVKE